MGGLQQLLLLLACVRLYVVSPWEGWAGFRPDIQQMGLRVETLNPGAVQLALTPRRIAATMPAAAAAATAETTPTPAAVLGFSRLML